MKTYNKLIRLLKISFGTFPKLSLFSFLLIVFSVLLDLPLPLLTVYFIDKVIAGKDVYLLNLIGFLLVGFLIFKIASDFLNRYLNTWLIEKITMHYGVLTFSNFINSYYFAHLSKPAGYWVNRIQNEPQSIAAIFRSLVEILTMSITFIAGIFFTFYFSLELGLAVLFILPFYVWAMFVLGPKIKRQSIIIKEERSKLSGFIEESLNGLEILKVLSIEKFRLNELKVVWNTLVKENVRMTVIMSLNGLVAMSIASLAPIIVLWYGGYLVIIGTLTLGKVIGINKFLSYIFRPVSSFISINAQIQDTFAALERMDEITNFPKERQNGKDVQIKNNADIKISDLVFGYNSKKIFDRINFNIKGGKVTAIIGESGCGKSTLLRLIIGLLQYPIGSIFIDDINIKNINIESLRKQVCLIPQNAYLFSGSIDYNIRFGGNGKDIDKYLLEVTGINKFFDDVFMDSNYDIGSKGQKLSGGQRQRIALARALIREPKILFMDEVTSEIDLETEKEIIERLIELRKGKTTIIVAHGIAAVRKADEIIVMSNGKVEERGNHEELLKKETLYKKLWLMNMGEKV